jgi:hypothetical protein
MRHNVDEVHLLSSRVATGVRVCVSWRDWIMRCYSAFCRHSCCRRWYRFTRLVVGDFGTEVSTSIPSSRGEFPYILILIFTFNSTSILIIWHDDNWIILASQLRNWVIKWKALTVRFSLRHSTFITSYLNASDIRKSIDSSPSTPLTISIPPIQGYPYLSRTSLWHSHSHSVLCILKTYNMHWRVRAASRWRWWVIGRSWTRHLLNEGTEVINCEKHLWAYWLTDSRSRLGYRL